MSPPVPQTNQTHPPIPAPPAMGGERSDLLPHHRKELVEGSAIALPLAELNVESVEGERVISFLAQNLGRSARRNDGRLRDHWLKKFYAVSDDGGMMFSGVRGEYQFKPDRPRCDRSKPGKPVKYETPQGEKLGAYLPLVDEGTWRRISDRYQIALPEVETFHQVETFHETPLLSPARFWNWVEENPNIPRLLSEGAKKTLAGLSADYATVGVGGCRMAYRRDENGRAHLIPDIQRLAVKGSRWYLAFDQDTKAKTRADVADATAITARLLEAQGCEVKIVSWNPKDGKGLDDLIVNQGKIALYQAIHRAPSFATWQLLRGNALNGERTLEICQRYLDIDIPPDERLVCIRSAKNTGKSVALAQLAERHLKDFDGRRIVGITHRIQLCKMLAEKLGLPYVTERSSTPEGDIFGLVLCFDSLKPNGQARFLPENYSDCVIFLDEVEQSLMHLLNSSTCARDRVVILQTFEALLKGASQVVLCDADLTDSSINLIRSLMGGQTKPYIIENHWKPSDEQAWTVHHYDHSTPKHLFANLKAAIARGEKVLVSTTGQKINSVWGTQSIETQLKQEFPERRILRIDAESVAEPGHPANGCIAHLNETVVEFDIVISSPSIETGVSIDVAHFNSVWGIFWGITPPNGVRQTLSRYRSPVERHIWVQQYGTETVGNGAVFPKELLKATHSRSDARKRYLRANEKIGELMLCNDIDSPDWDFQSPSLWCWAYMGARQNFGMKHLRQAVLWGLEAEGHRIIEGLESDEADEAKEGLVAAKEANYCAEIDKDLQIEAADRETLKQLEDKVQKTSEERAIIRQTKRCQKLAINKIEDETTIRKIDKGWVKDLERHYYLTVGAEFVRDREWRSAKPAINAGAIWLPDFASRERAVGLGMLRALGVLDLVNADVILSKGDPVLGPIANRLRSSRKDQWALKVALGITITEKSSDINVAQSLLGLLGLKTVSAKRRGTGKERVRVYCKPAPEFLKTLDDKGKERLAKDENGDPMAVWDNREEIFERWLERDRGARSEYEREFAESMAAAASAVTEAICEGQSASLAHDGTVNCRSVPSGDCSAARSEDEETERVSSRAIADCEPIEKMESEPLTCGYKEGDRVGWECEYTGEWRSGFVREILGPGWVQVQCDTGQVYIKESKSLQEFHHLGESQVGESERGGKMISIQGTTDISTSRYLDY